MKICYSPSSSEKFVKGLYIAFYCTILMKRYNSIHMIL